MHHLAARRARWLRRSTALAGAAGLVALQSLAPATALIRPSSGQPTAPVAKVSAHSGRDESATYPGPQMYNPKTKTVYPTKSSVTVSQVSNLVDQFVTVSWKGFTPSNTQGLVGYGPLVAYPVEVAICKGTDPQQPTSTYCDGATQTGEEIYGAAGPTTEVYGLTGAAASTTEGGSGSVAIQVQTVAQNSYLGCDENNPCSLVVIPVDGGNDDFANGKLDCGDHKGDVNDLWATTGKDFPNSYYCDWASRIVVPLHFAPGGTNCKFSNPDFTIVGSPLMERAMGSWIAKLCSGSDPLHFSFEGTVDEPAARTDFLEGADDVALTTDPATPPYNRKFTYAPVGISAESIAFWLDNPATGSPYTTLNLNPRIVAKLLTTSYDFGGFGCPNVNQYGCDSAVSGNPRNMFDDPDFQSINSNVVGTTVSGDQSDFVTVLSGNSDMTWELTRWIAANQDAESFLKGFSDPWGMRVNANYTNLALPEEQITEQDGFTVWSHQFSPQFPLVRVAQYQATNWNPGISWEPQVNGNGPPTYPANPVEQPGSRDQIAILDEPDAAALDLPVAGLLNDEKKYVTPTQASMTAAVNDMTVNPDGITRDDNESAKNPGAYPLTMVVYAMVPTSGVPESKAAKIARWLDYVAGPGQSTGIALGQLPAGYLPLPSFMRKQTLKAAYEVLHQTGTTRPADHRHPPSPKSSSPAPKNSPSPNSGSNSTTPNAAKINASYSSPDSSGLGRWLLPLLLVAGGLLLLAGPSALVLGRPGGRAAVLAGWSRIRTLRFPNLRGRKK